jgi:hypothetical protein
VTETLRAVIERKGSKIAAVARRLRETDVAIGHVHAHGLHRGVEYRRTDVGLPLSWIAVHARWPGDLRASGNAAGTG